MNVGNDVKEPLVTVTYRAEELRSVPEKNIKVFHVYQESQIYSSVEDITLDTGTHTVSFVPKENGLYLLVDIYAYGSARGWAVSKYAYESDKTSYESDWERMSDTGDIMKLADKEWVRANAPECHVRTAALVGWGGGTECVCENCELDITVNGQKESYMTANEKTRQLFSDDSLITLSINEQGQVQRTELSDRGNYKNLSWVIKQDGKQILRRGADNELTIPAWVWEKNFEKMSTLTHRL